MVRKTYIIGNWKMNGVMPEALTLVNDILTAQAQFGDACVMICPPAPLLVPLSAVIKKSQILIGGQDCHHEADGAFTGDISANMLRDAGASHVILGHSERRQFHGETSTQIFNKALQAWDAGLSVIYCIGESAKEHESGSTLEILEQQLQPFYAENCHYQKLIIAYEPVWAIGTGLTPTPTDANNIHGFIRSGFAREFGEKMADHLSILYGGSMKPNNAKDFLQEAHIDGGLIGGASLNSQDFIHIIQSALH